MRLQTMIQVNMVNDQKHEEMNSHSTFSDHLDTNHRNFFLKLTHFN